MFTPNGPAGIFALYVSPTANLGRVFLNEFVCVSPDGRLYVMLMTVLVTHRLLPFSRTS